MAILTQERPRVLARWTLSIRRGPVVGTAAFLISATILLLVACCAIWPQAVAPYNPTVNSLSLRHKPPGFVDANGGVHLLGTDHMGRDVWSRLVWGARASMLVGCLGLLLGGTVGVGIGMAAGYLGGWLDRIAMRVVDVYLSLPYILIAIVWAALVGTDMRELILIVAVRGWVEFARVTRGQTLAVRERYYISAAQAIGASGWRIVRVHILPNTMASILVVAGFQLGVLILLEATLSFLGLGIRPPTPAWGSMLSDARNYLSEAWWTVLFPGMAISLVVMSANFIGDSLRDRFDPALRGKP